MGAVRRVTVGQVVSPHDRAMCDPFGFTDDLPGEIDVVMRIRDADTTRSRIVIDPTARRSAAKCAPQRAVAR